MIEGILPINKPKGKTSFDLVRALRRHLGVRKIGHTGTLDPFATGVMIMLIGKNYTKLSDKFLHQEKEYLALVRLGVSTDTFDCDGTIVATSDLQPSEEQVREVVARFQGTINQLPPMYSAKKKNGKKLYEFARKGIEIEREPVQVEVETELVRYQYPNLTLRIQCSKGTYIRAIADDMGTMLGCGGHLEELQRTRNGKIRVEDCLDGSLLDTAELDIAELNGCLKLA